MTEEDRRAFDERRRTRTGGAFKDGRPCRLMGHWFKVKPRKLTMSFVVLIQGDTPIRREHQGRNNADCIISDPMTTHPKKTLFRWDQWEANTGGDFVKQMHVRSVRGTFKGFREQGLLRASTDLKLIATVFSVPAATGRESILECLPCNTLLMGVELLHLREQGFCKLLNGRLTFELRETDADAVRGGLTGKGGSRGLSAAGPMGGDSER